MNLALRETLVAFADAHGLRPDWHEPDEGGVGATLHGDHLDNAYGDEPASSGKRNKTTLALLRAPSHRAHRGQRGQVKPTDPWPKVCRLCGYVAMNPGEGLRHTLKHDGELLDQMVFGGRIQEKMGKAE